jgi:hypothetical protein
MVVIVGMAMIVVMTLIFSFTLFIVVLVSRQLELGLFNTHRVIV